MMLKSLRGDEADFSTKGGSMKDIEKIIVAVAWIFGIGVVIGYYFQLVWSWINGKKG